MTESSRVNMTVASLATVSTLMAALGHLWWKTDIFEATAFVTAVISIYLLAVESVWGWPFGVVSSGIYVYVFAIGGLPADAGLNLFYVGMLLHGWFVWARKRLPSAPFVISRAGARGWVLAALACAGLSAVHYPIVLAAHGKVPVWDSVLASASYVGQYMQNTKKLENWLLWIVVDLLYCPLYLSRGLYLTAILYVVLAGLAFFGLQKWRHNGVQLPRIDGQGS